MNSAAEAQIDPNIRGLSLATAGPQAPGAFGVVTLLFVYAGLWLYMTPYIGLGHDAQAYAVQALARHGSPQLAGDVFLAYRSQEEFTVFPFVYSWLIDGLGLDRAAALSTLICQLGWYVV